MAQVTIHEYGKLNIVAKKGQQVNLVITIGDGLTDHSAKDAYMCVSDPIDPSVILREWTKTGGELVPGDGIVTLDLDETDMALPTRPLPYFMKLIDSGTDEPLTEGFFIVVTTPGA